MAEPLFQRNKIAINYIGDPILWKIIWEFCLLAFVQCSLPFFFYKKAKKLLTNKGTAGLVKLNGFGALALHGSESKCKATPPNPSLQKVQGCIFSSDKLPRIFKNPFHPSKSKDIQPSFAVVSIFSITNITLGSQNIHFNHSLLGEELPASL